MKAANAECLASARAVAPCIQPFDNLLDAEGTGFSVAMEVQFKDQANGLGLDGIDVELLLDFRASTSL